jgi:hypothetical protein
MKNLRLRARIDWVDLLFCPSTPALLHLPLLFDFMRHGVFGMHMACLTACAYMGWILLIDGVVWSTSLVYVHLHL